MNGKGSRPRGQDAASRKRYAEGWDRVFDQLAPEWLEVLRQLKREKKRKRLPLANNKNGSTLPTHHNTRDKRET